MKAADRVLAIQAPSFSALAAKKAAYTNRTGKPVIDFSIGSSNIPPAKAVQEIMAEAVQDPASYQYSLGIEPEFLEAVKIWYKERYHTILEDDEIAALKGSQEALTHLPMVLCNPGDIMFVPDPYYPIYGTAPGLAGAQPYFLPMRKEKGYDIDFEAVPEDIARKAKCILVSYPSNPTGSLAPEGFYERLISFAKKYDLVIIHDNAYSELVFDGKPGKSFLEYPGAKEIGIELNSLSKSYSMGGARLAVMVGNKDVIQAYKQLMDTADFGPFPAVQKAGAECLLHQQAFAQSVREEYKRRRDFLIEHMKEAGWNMDKPEATMFVWAPVPEGMSSQQFTNILLEKAGVLVNPGSNFGKEGEGFVRLALVRSDEEVKEAAKRIAQAGLFA
jgi:LL-diaminopimelate aminotransferase